MSLVSANWKPNADQLRVFGLIGLVAFAALGLVAYFAHRILFFSLQPSTAQTTAYVLWALAAACGVLSQVAPAALRPLYVLMMAVALPIGFVVSHVVVALIYYAIITPLGLVFRVMGRDALSRKFDPAAATYWTPRGPPPPADRYYRQF